jgi:serine/threonine-protein kinase RsbW
VHAAVDTLRLIVEIADEGTPFDLDADTRDATSPENLEREDGRGLFLMRKLMDDVQRFDATAGEGSAIGNGNVVRLTLSRE